MKTHYNGNILTTYLYSVQSVRGDKNANMNQWEVHRYNSEADVRANISGKTI